MDDNEAIKLLRAAILITQSKHESTITPINLQRALEIMYIDNPILNTLIHSGGTYIITFHQNKKQKFNSFTHYNTLIRDHLNNGQHNKIYRIGAGTIQYFCGVADELNGQKQEFN